MRLIALTVLASLIVAPPATAKVDLVNANGFVVRLSADVGAEPATAWRTLVSPKDWWSAEHSYSGDAANFTLDPRPGGCFCEALPGEGAGMPPRGGVEHMRVVYVEQPRALRMVGALGPLQAEALTGTLTIQLKPIEAGGTRILWEYVVGGLMRPKPDEIAPAVDAVLGEQLGRFVAKLGSKPVSDDETLPAPQDPANPPKDVIIGR